MPDPIFHSNGNEENEYDSKTRTLDYIKMRYGEQDLDTMDSADAWRRHDLVAQWYEWCDREYPNTKRQGWQDIAAAAGKDVDIRLLLRACFAVDEALCGTDMEALAMVKKWHVPQQMGAYSYLLSKEMTRWWAAELAELETEIKSTFSSRVSLSWRVEDLSRCLERLDVVMELGEGIGTNIWTIMEECSEGYIEPPAGLSVAIYDRVDRLRTSVLILLETLERREQGEGSLNTLPLATHSSADPGGMRRRIPRPASPSINEQTLVINEDHITLPSNTASSIRIDSLPEATISKSGLQYLSSQLKLAVKHAQKLTLRYQSTRFLAWLTHKETSIVVSIFLVVTSVYFMSRSFVFANSQPSTSKHSFFSDSSFLGNLSQSILSYLSIYLIIVATAHKRSGGLRYRSWLWFLLALSFVSTVLGLGLSVAVPPASVLFLWVAAFAQVVIPVLLVTMAGKSETVNEYDVESHRD